MRRKPALAVDQHFQADGWEGQGEPLGMPEAARSASFTTRIGGPPRIGGRSPSEKAEALARAQAEAQEKLAAADDASCPWVEVVEAARSFDQHDPGDWKKETRLTSEYFAQKRGANAGSSLRMPFATSLATAVGKREDWECGCANMVPPGGDCDDDAVWLPPPKPTPRNLATAFASAETDEGVGREPVTLSGPVATACWTHGRPIEKVQPRKTIDTSWWCSPVYCRERGDWNENEHETVVSV